MKRPYGNFIIKRKLKFENYKSSSEASQLENEINHLQKNQIDLDILKKYYKEFIKSNKLILKTQQRFKSESHNVFTKKINKIALSSNDNKIMQSLDSIETHMKYETSKDLISDKRD